MPVTQQGFVPLTSVSVTISASQNIKITNLSMPLANTEYSLLLTNNLKQLIIVSRSMARLQIAFTSTESGTKFITIPKGTSLSLFDLDLTGKTLYIQGDVPTSTVEIMELY